MAEHPVEAHEYLLSDMKKRIDDLEYQVADLMQWKAGSEERLKQISEAIVELKRIMENYTKEVKESSASIAKDVAGKFEAIDKDIQELRGRPGRKWDDLMRTLMTVAVGTILGYIFTVILKG